MNDGRDVRVDGYVEIRAEDRARSFASAASAQDDSRGHDERSPVAAASVAGIALLTLLSILAVSMLTFVLSACAQGPRIEIVGADGLPRAAVAVEIADTPAGREYGLMFRKQLDERAGMIFVFKEQQHLQFWMKNTIISLDMIFADSHGKIVGIVRKAEPFSEATDSVDGDSQYVLEVNGGFCDRHGVKAGDTLRFVGFVPKAAD
jgi:uncharacterized membrane protein (UPF0127 family)